jgi:hypothetical protein
MFKATSARATVRLALLQDASASEALLFELPRRAPGWPGGPRSAPPPLLRRPFASDTGASGSGGGGSSPRVQRSSSSFSGGCDAAGRGAGASAPLCCDGGVAVTRLDMRNTLLAAAVVDRQARFVRDCSQYMQVRKGGRVRGPQRRLGRRRHARAQTKRPSIEAVPPAPPFALQPPPWRANPVPHPPPCAAPAPAELPRHRARRLHPQLGARVLYRCGAADRGRAAHWGAVLCAGGAL